MAARGIPRIFVGNLPWTIGRKELRDYFSQFGPIQTVNVFFDKETGVSRNFGFVQFSSREGYLNLSRETNHFLEGNRLTVTDVTAAGTKPTNPNTSSFAGNRVQGTPKNRQQFNNRPLTTNITQLLGKESTIPKADQSS